MSEPTLEDIAKQIADLDIKTEQQISLLRKEVAEIKQLVEKLDSRFFDFSMRVVSANQSAFWSISIALLSAAIAFVVARISDGRGL